MKPGHLNVFNGLRMTTEHMNHLQGSIHSNFQDLREILGLGKVHMGLTVEAEGEQSIRVQPGIAFDRLKNRLVLETPTSLEVKFPPNVDTLYVGLKYDQVEDGQVEGTFTLIYDSYKLSLLAAEPGESDNVVILARLIRVPERGFRIEPAEAKSATVQPEVGENAPIPSEPPGATKSSNGASGGNGNLSDATAVTAPPTVTDSKAVGATPPAVTDSTAPALPATASNTSPRLEIQQGMLRMASEIQNETVLARDVASELRRRLAAGASASDVEILFPLAESRIDLSYRPRGVSAQVILRVELEPSEGMREVSAGAPEAPAARAWQFECASHGEATYAAGSFVQQALTMTRCRCSAAGVVAYSAEWQPEMTSRAFAQLPLDAPRQYPEVGSLAPAETILPQLGLLLQAQATEVNGLNFVCNLVWKGGLTAANVEQFEGTGYRMKWSSQVGWKAVGS